MSELFCPDPHPFIQLLMTIFHRGGALVDPTPETERELKSELERIAKQFGGGAGTDMAKFPEFKFTEPALDPINAATEEK